MKIIVDEIPKEAKDCIFSRDRNFDCSLGNHECLNNCPYLKPIRDYYAEEIEYIGNGYSTHRVYPIVDGGGSHG